MKTNLETLQSAAGAMSTQLDSMQTKLDSLSGVTIPEVPMAQLTTSVKTLNAGMQGLDTAIGSLSANVKTLQTKTASLPTAGAGIGTLLAGFDTLSANNKALTDGAKEFEEEGTKKLKDTVEDDLMSVIDRIKALSSDDCTYDTFSGKADGVDSNVKFIIETDPIE